jgi:hypothetical protein
MLNGVMPTSHLILGYGLVLGERRNRTGICGEGYVLFLVYRASNRASTRTGDIRLKVPVLLSGRVAVFSKGYIW